MKRKKIYLSDRRRTGKDGKEFVLEGMVNFLPAWRCGDYLSRADVLTLIESPDYDVHISTSPLYFVKPPEKAGLDHVDLELGES